MAIYIVPSYIKPYSKILSWALPLCYVEEEKQEYICDLKIVTTAIRERVRAYTKYQLLTMLKDIRGNPERFKVLPDASSIYYVPLEDFISKATEDRELASFKGEFNLLSQTAEDLINKVFSNLDRDLRAVIAVPMQWLVYSREDKVLSRMCWVVTLRGDITIRPYGTTNILLEVDKLSFDKINQVSLRVLKRHVLIKIRVDEVWRALVASEVMEEKAPELQTGIEEVGEEEIEEEVGEVE